MPDERMHPAADMNAHRQPYLRRPRLDALLAEAVRNPLVLVVAGAGYGKTHAVRAFLQERPETVSWVHLSERDNLGSRFWGNLLRALSASNPPVAALLRGFDFPSSEAQVERFLDVLHHKHPRAPHIVVVDDVHLLQNREVLQVAARLLHALVNSTTVILVSRTTPNIKMVGLLSRNLVSHLDQSDLCFTEEETRDYLRLLGLQPSKRVLANIQRSTEGWAFAVTLMGRCLQKAGGREALAVSAMKLNVFQLIESEIFSPATPDLQHWLIRFSLLDRLPRELLRRLGFGEELEPELGRIGSFVYYDRFLDLYQIHHLFLEYLAQKQDRLGEEERRETYLRTGEWCEESGYKLDAITCYERAGRYDRIVVVVDTLSLVVPFDIATFVLEAFDRAPAGTFEGVAKYSTMRLRLLISTGRIEEVRAEARGIVDRYSSLPASPYIDRVLCGAHNCLGVTDLLYPARDDGYDFPGHFAEADRFYSRTPFTTGVKTSMDLGAYACMVTPAQDGLLADYLQGLTQAVGHASHSYDGYMYGLDDLAQGELAYFRGDLKTARRFALQARHKARQLEQYDIANRALFYQLRVAVAQGAYEEAGGLLTSLEAQLGQEDYYFRDVTYDIVAGWYHLAIGQLERVAGWLKAEFEPRSFNIPLIEFVGNLKAKVFYRQGRHEELLAVVGSDRYIRRFLLGALEMKVLEACSLHRLQERMQALEALREVYDMALPHGLEMPFVELGKDMRTLTTAALRDEGCRIPRIWLEWINTRSSLYARKLQKVSAEFKREHSLDDDVSLTERELEVLADLRAGLSRSQIAAARHLSINTVKSRLNMIYAKLGAQNKTDAIRIAQERGLLPS